jgi:fused signal recognition particle receptor
VLLAAADTFRAAAVQQLQIWGRRVPCEVVSGKEGADPSSVAFTAIEQAKAAGVDVVIVDTAGRLHTKVPLMDELKKIHRVVGKAQEGAPHEVLLVLDANTGQNAIQQAATFRDAVRVTGIVLTKLDGTAKGGVILGICDEQKIPVRFIGVGEGIDDLRPFDTELFVAALFDDVDEVSAAA